MKFASCARRGFPFAILFCLAVCVSPCSTAHSQVTAPRYEECLLAGIFPAGGQQGQTVAVDLMGGGNANMSDARDVIVDGPPGLIVRDVKTVSPNLVQAKFEIAPDAPPGRRCVRVLSERSGLTNMLYFTVGRLPEAIEKEPNNEGAVAEALSLPIVVNGRVDPKTDADCFSFPLAKGQRLTAAVLAHAIDSHGQGGNYGVVDANLALLDERGRVVAEAGDTLGLDPCIDFTAPEDGRYVARVTLEAFEGFPQAVYRLVLADLALPTSIFPPGGQRGSVVEVELNGPGVAAGARRSIAVPADDPFPFQRVSSDDPTAADYELPFVRGEYPERCEAEPNEQNAQATPLELPLTVNGRIDRLGDVDCYRLSLAAGQAVSLETVAQRFLKSPIDTSLEVYDATGKMLAENDDGIALDYVSMHDFRPMDSRLTFTAPAAGDYFVQVADRSGGEGGARAVYRLTATGTTSDFELHLFPDGVPIWGPGTTAALLVKVTRFDQMNGEIALSVEGLPAGWVASPAVCRGTDAQPSQIPTLYYFLTVTAPPEAKVGEMFPFRVVGRAQINGRTVERIARPLTLYYTSDTGFFRLTPTARVAVAKPQTPWLATPLETLQASVGGALEIPVQVLGAEKVESLDLTADLATSGVATAIDVPKAVAIKDGQAVVPVKLGESIRPGVYGIVVSLRWRSDIRIGMPGPCTRLIRLQVNP